MYYDKITDKDMFQKIKELLPENDDIQLFCDNKIKGIEVKSNNAKIKAESKRCDRDELTQKIYEIIKNSSIKLSVKNISNAVRATYDNNVTDSQVLYRLNSLSRNGLIKKEDSKSITKNTPIKIYWV